MFRRFALTVLFFVSLGMWADGIRVHAQFGGSRAGIVDDAPGVPDLPEVERKVVDDYIAIDGRAELRVKPTVIRIVLAITSEGDSAKSCHEEIDALVKKLRSAWGELKIREDDIVEDFIAILPMYEWELEKRETLEVGVEKKTGFRMQTNIHLSVPNDRTAPAALAAAFSEGVTDIIAFDYWSRELDDAKVKVRKEAVKAARAKSDTLLGALFDAIPQVINVREKTTVHYPKSLYESFENTLDQSVVPAWRREIRYIHAYRPQNTYYRGLFTDGDVQSRELPMRPEISVVSTVRLYFRPPAKP